MAWTDFGSNYWAYQDLVKASKLNLMVTNITDNHERTNDLKTELESSFIVRNYSSDLDWHEVTTNGQASAWVDTEFLMTDWELTVIAYRMNYDVEESDIHTHGIWFRESTQYPGKWQVVVETAGSNLSVIAVVVMAISKNITVS